MEQPPDSPAARPAGIDGANARPHRGAVDAGPAPRQRALQNAVREIEQHVAGSGWDGPVRLFALIRTATALARDPALAQRLPAEVISAAARDGEHLTAVEQEDLPTAPDLSTLLAGIAWPETVDGAAVVVERVVLPPEAEADLPADPQAAQAALLADPRRRDVRLAVGVLRDGARACAVRARDHDADDRVATGPELVPGLTSALAATFDPQAG